MSSEFSIFDLHARGEDLQVMDGDDVVVVAEPFEDGGYIGFSFRYPADEAGDGAREAADEDMSAEGAGL